MSNLRTGLNLINKLLKPLNLQLDTLTRSHLEERRLGEVDRHGWFDRVAYSVPPGFLNSTHQFLLDELPKHRARFDSFQKAEANDVEFQFNNSFYNSPDVEVLYAMVRAGAPKRILEIGCGNSTKIIRQAIRDGKLSCHHVAIDPFPRLDISKLVDEMIRLPVEHAAAVAKVQALETGDILFIDTSHEVMPANDVAYIYGQLLGHVRAGVVVHIHDIFIPFEYPRPWIMESGLKWGEQYVVHAMLMNDANWQVLWPGYYLQRTLPGFDSHFPNLAGGMAQSLWLRRM